MRGLHHMCTYGLDTHTHTTDAKQRDLVPISKAAPALMFYVLYISMYFWLVVQKLTDAKRSV